MGRYILCFSLCRGMWPEMTGHKYHHCWWGVGGGVVMVSVTGTLEGGGSQKGAPTTPRARKPFFFQSIHTFFLISTMDTLDVRPD